MIKHRTSSYPMKMQTTESDKEVRSDINSIRSNMTKEIL
jgi:hypothetical protein